MLLSLSGGQRSCFWDASFRTEAAANLSFDTPVTDFLESIGDLLLCSVSNLLDALAEPSTLCLLDADFAAELKDLLLASTIAGLVARLANVVCVGALINVFPHIGDLLNVGDVFSLDASTG